MQWHGGVLGEWDGHWIGGSCVQPRSAFLRGGLWALLIGVPLLCVPLVVGWLRPGPTDPRVYSNLLLLPVFSIPIFLFGGFIGMFRALSRQAQLGSGSAAQGQDWAHDRTHAEADPPPADTRNPP